MKGRLMPFRTGTYPDKVTATYERRNGYLSQHDFRRLDMSEIETTPESKPEVTATETTFTQEQVSAIAAKEAKKAEKKATESFISSLGFSNPDELKGALDAFREHQEQQKTQEQRLAELQQEREQRAGKATRYESTVASLLDRELELIPEDRRSLVPEFDDPVQKLDYIAQNKQFLVGAPNGIVNVGTQGSPAPQVVTPISFDDYKNLNGREMFEFTKSHPEVASQFAERLRQGSK
jgi:hypothetical protein